MKVDADHRNNKKVSFFSDFKLFLFIIMILLFVVNFNSAIFDNSIASLADEFFLLISILIIFISFIYRLSKNKIEKINFILLIYLVYQIVSSLHSPFELKLGLALTQSLINIKIFLVSFATLLLWENTVLYRKIVKYVFIFFILSFSVGLTANFFLQEKWHILMGHSGVIGYRYGFIRPVGWLGHPGQNSYFFCITYVTLCLLYAKKPAIEAREYVKIFFIFTIIDFLMVFPLSVRKGIVMVVPFGALTFSYLKRQWKIIFSIITPIFIAVFFLIIKDTKIVQVTINNLINMTSDVENHYIRGLMVFNGVLLFWKFFPFGVGCATFGTTLSQFNTLDVYDYVGLNLYRIYYKNGRLSGVYDSGMFSMFAENGFFGMILICSIIYFFFRINHKMLDKHNYNIFKVITWFAILLSITEPVWQNGTFTVIYTINMLFIYSKNNLYRMDGKWVRLDDNN